MKLSTDKRNKLIMVALGTVAAIAALWYLLISGQAASLRDVKGKIEAANDRQHKIEMSVKQAEKIKADLATADKQMSQAEQGLASGDLYSWMYNTIKEFKLDYRIEIPQFSAAELGDCSLIYKFPFKQTRMTVTGTAYYHDLGRFIADLENHFTFMRIQNLEMMRGGGANAVDREKLAFRMDIIALVNAIETK